MLPLISHPTSHPFRRTVPRTEPPALEGDPMAPKPLGRTSAGAPTVGLPTSGFIRRRTSLGCGCRYGRPGGLPHRRAPVGGGLVSGRRGGKGGLPSPPDGGGGGRGALPARRLPRRRLRSCGPGRVRPRGRGAAPRRGRLCFSPRQ